MNEVKRNSNYIVSCERELSFFLTRLGLAHHMKQTDEKASARVQVYGEVQVKWNACAMAASSFVYIDK